ncbi:hypothetical protein KY284_036930 [Solanum tuberosum]|nr:hypothetical protein KY284_036930 [Solanum tuberosum]
MADRIVIDLVEDEFNCEEAESYQDKIAKLEGKVAKMEQEIDGIKEMIANLKKSSYENSLDYDIRSSDEDLEGYSPIRATAYSNFDCNAQYFSNMHPLSQNEAFGNLGETSKDGENGGRHFNIETNQISFTNEHASQLGKNLVEMESENETPHNLVDIPMYDGIGLPQNHLKAYLDWTLTGPALMWYANQDTRKWLSWVDMAKDFIKKYGPPNRASKGRTTLDLISLVDT